MSMLTLRIDTKLDQQLAELAAASGKTKSEVAREALRRQLVRQTLDTMRAELQPLAQAHGIYTDEDVLKLVEERRQRRRLANNTPPYGPEHGFSGVTPTLPAVGDELPHPPISHALAPDAPSPGLHAGEKPEKAARPSRARRPQSMPGQAQTTVQTQAPSAPPKPARKPRITRTREA